MNEGQLNLFELPNQVSSTPTSTPRIRLSSSIADVRTAAQQKRSISYDVGVRIGGARKDLATQRQAFLDRPSADMLTALEKMDTAAAAEVMVRDTFFKWFSLEDCKMRGVDPGVAKAIQLFINRVPKAAKDTPADRLKYTGTLLFLSDLLKTVTTKEEYYLFESRVVEALTVSQDQALLEGDETYLQSVRSQLASGNVQSDYNIKEMTLGLQKTLARLFLRDQSFGYFRLKDYPGSFRNYFYDRASRRTMLLKAFSISEWEELLPPPTDESSPKKKGNRKPIWQRVLPDKPTRVGGPAITMTDPKAYVEHFKLRASEFGHYVNDRSGEQHLQRSAEAFTDLAEILKVPHQSVSHGGRLAMAFGSRGRGRALGHYEPGRQVINLTKEKGSLGILAHEWFHSLDHFLYNLSYDFKNGVPGYVTDQNYGTLPPAVTEAIDNLVDALKTGESTAYIDVTEMPSYSMPKDYQDTYRAVGGDLRAYMELRLEELDIMMGLHFRKLSGTARVKAEKKYAGQRQRRLTKEAKAVADYHFAETGEKVDRVPYPVYHSDFYQHSVVMDKGNVGKYWSSNVELAARAFEYYIHTQLMERDWVSDYLVCGIRDAVFPQNEDEGERIVEAMEALIVSIRPLLAE